MEMALSLAIGMMTTCGVWLILRPRTYQVIIGLSLLSYAVNLFIFGVGGVKSNMPPILEDGVISTSLSDPVPQALVLTAIVIGFATTALFLVVLLASGGLTGSDHVDGRNE
ncbi:Na+/H+ antiporter subunit C [Rhizobium glycinendophyticum]|uniref:Na+/H+ antiporter subunit C n=1 Tax=Rhizobium glycinendophyticum TaxID=2589807 RepID=A0A504TPM1_9HYPH|nr:Na+/H+ antiporter subunit C [Rhizobium glycinendophyticum]TPP03969.1 Na+/H+ antiporter subunit C [Rhizobium glycinendophyticum]